MTRVTPHLSLAELACKDGTPYPIEFISDGRVLVLGRAFEQLRALAGGVPLVVLSAYRTPARNRAVGGARHSQHVEGRALDLRPPRGLTVRQFAALARQITDIRGIGVYPTFLHIDVREASRLVVWHGSRRAADGDRS